MLQANSRDEPTYTPGFSKITEHDTINSTKHDVHSQVPKVTFSRSVARHNIIPDSLLPSPLMAGAQRQLKTHAGPRGIGMKSQLTTTYRNRHDFAAKHKHPLPRSLVNIRLPLHPRSTHPAHPSGARLCQSPDLAIPHHRHRIDERFRQRRLDRVRPSSSFPLPHLQYPPPPQLTPTPTATSTPQQPSPPTPHHSRTSSQHPLSPPTPPSHLSARNPLTTSTHPSSTSASARSHSAS